MVFSGETKRINWTFPIICAWFETGNSVGYLGYLYILAVPWLRRFVAPLVTEEAGFWSPDSPSGVCWWADWHWNLLFSEYLWVSCVTVIPQWCFMYQPSVDTVVKSITFLSVDCQWRVINSVSVYTVLATNSRSNVFNLNSEVKLIEVNERQKWRG